MDVGLEVAKQVGKSIVSYLKARLDPNLSRRLDEEITAHVLSELPRIIALLEDRCADLEARGCSHVEANIIAHQVIEEQKRTLDEDKRRRLTNVLVNGLSAQHWDKATHRLMVRMASELEEEHIECLHRRSKPPLTIAEHNADREARWKAREAYKALSAEAQLASAKLGAQRAAVENSLERELIGLGLLEEIRAPKAFAKPLAGEKDPDRGVFAERDMVTTIKVTRLGKLFLDYLRDPAELSAA